VTDYFKNTEFDLFEDTEFDSWIAESVPVYFDTFVDSSFNSFVDTSSNIWIKNVEPVFYFDSFIDTDINIFISTGNDIWIKNSSPPSPESEDLIATFDLLYGAGPVFTFFEQIYGLKFSREFNILYGDKPVISKLINCLYQDTSEFLKTFISPYEDAQQTTKKVSLPYKLIPSIVQKFDLVYKDVLELKKRFELGYSAATETKKKIDELYKILDDISVSIVESYSITADEVKTLFNLDYDLITNNKVQKTVNLPFHLLSGSVIQYTPAVSMTVNSEGVDFVSINLTISSSQYCFIADIQIASESTYIAIEKEDSVILEIDGEIYNLFVESKYKELELGQSRYMIECLSPTAKLDKPYSSSITQTYAADVTAQTVINEMAAIQSITADFQLFDDWTLDSTSFYIQGETPLEVIRKIVASVGGIIQTKPNGDLLLISEYPVSPKDWDTETPDGIILMDEEVLSLSESPVVNLGYNAFVVSNETAAENSIWLTEESLGDGVVEIRGFQVPFTDEGFDIETSRNVPVTINKDLYYTELQIPEVEEDEDPEWEYIEFIEWEGKTSFPIYELVDYEWIDDDLGTFSFEEDGKLTVDSPSTVPSESLLKIKYKTRFWRWEVSGPIDSYAQIFVPKIEETE
jgi:hypothetical protein